tara:strand:+ start:167 stop:739 length:573 start_codon:yes stop_codon:yes gene_type:complete
MKKISDVTFVLTYIISVSIAALLISTQPTIILENTIEATDTSEQKILKRIFPSDCLASSTLSDQYSCTNLYDDQYNFWSDDHNSCSVPTWIRFYFEKEIYVEFIVLQQIEDLDLFDTRVKIHEYRIQTSSFEYYPGTLENDTYSQWLDINENTTLLEIEVLSTHLPEKYENLSETNNCVLQEITFYGRDL